MKELLNSANNQINELKEDLNKFEELFTPLTERNDKLIFLEVEKLIDKYPANPLVILQLLYCLLLCNDDELIAQYEFSDIKNLIVQSCQLFKKDIDLNLEKYFYLKNIENTDEDATNFLVEFRKMIIKEIDDSQTSNNL